MTQPLTSDFSFPEPLALFLDFDGTLAGFKDDPDKVHLSPGQKQLLQNLSQTLDGALALISGRDLRDLSKRVPREIWRLGNHGLFKAAPHEEPPARLEPFPQALHDSIWKNMALISGTRLELKGPVIAIHHRANPKARQTILDAVTPLLADYPDHCLQAGHFVVEVKPRQANKGAALKAQMQIEPFTGRIPVMIGDDTTDEDGFIACQALGGLGIKIGDGDTAADYRLPSISDLYSYLKDAI